MSLDDSSDAPSFSSFLDDYFAECDEHLTEVRRLLLVLERSVGRPTGDRATIDELFRHFHSMKGISAMVELRGAEDVAHALEGYLRALRQQDVQLDIAGIDALFDGTQVLDNVIAARRTGATPTAPGVVIERLAALVPRGGHSGQAESDMTDPVSGSSNRPVWRVQFSPSRERAARGIRVETIRQRLTAIGAILQAIPRVAQDGSIAFEFLLSTEADAETFAAWQVDGVIAERVGEPASEHADGKDRSADAASSRLNETVAPSHYVRVDLTRLDELMRNVGDIVITRARLSDALTRGNGALSPVDWRDVSEHNRVIERQLRTLREGIMRARLVPIDEIFRRMPFVVRDLARETGKSVAVELRGQATEIDKFLVERMMDPVLHLVRNAFSHAIEPVEERIAAGKPSHGTITLAASTSGDAVCLEIADDGRGIDADAVVERARTLGMPTPSASAIDAGALLALITSPGFSTRAHTDRASGRGVGMAVVKSAVEELSGSLTLETERGRGTRFIIELPVTLSITDALIARVGRETFAVPQGPVREVIEVQTAALQQLERSEVLPHRDVALPIARLASMFGMPDEPRERLHVFVVGTGKAAVGFAVDRIVGQREIVVRAISDALARVDGVSGATDLGDGRVVLILDPAALARRVNRAEVH